MKCGETINYTKQLSSLCVVLAHCYNNKALCAIWKWVCICTSLSLIVQMALERKHGKLHVRLATPERRRHLWASRGFFKERWEISSYPLPRAGNWLTMKWKWDGAALFARPPPNLYYTLPDSRAACAHVLILSWKLHGWREVHFDAADFLRDEIFFFAPWARWDSSWDEMELFMEKW